MDWTGKKAKEAEATLRKWFLKTDGVEAAATVPSRIVDALSDDLNVSMALSEMQRMSGPALKSAMRLLGFPDAEDVDWFRVQGSDLVGVAMIGEGNLSHAQELLNPILRRWQSMRDEKNYQEADNIKEVLEGMQVELKATGQGPQATVRDYGLLDSKKLEALK